MVKEVCSTLPTSTEQGLAQKIIELTRGDFFEKIPLADGRRSLRPGDIVNSETDLVAGFIVGSGVGLGATFYRLYCLDRDSGSERNLDGSPFDLQMSSRFPLGLMIENSEQGKVVGFGLKGERGGVSHVFWQKDLSIFRLESDLRTLSNQYVASTRAAEILDYLTIFLFVGSTGVSVRYPGSQPAQELAFEVLVAGLAALLISSALGHSAKDIRREIGNKYRDTFANDPKIQNFFEGVFK